MVIFFDLDDTLVDSHSAVEFAVCAVCSSLRIDRSLQDFLWQWREAHAKYYPRYLGGMLSHEEVCRLQVREVVDRDISDDRADAIFASYMAAYEDKWTIFEDVLPCLDALRGYGLGVISNGPSAEQRRKLARFGIDKKFETILISEEWKCRKPDAGIFVHACEMAGVAPAEAVYIGDKFEIDFLGANAAGMRGVWLNRKGVVAPAANLDVVASLRQIPAILKSPNTDDLPDHQGSGGPIAGTI